MAGRKKHCVPLDKEVFFKEALLENLFVKRQSYLLHPPPKKLQKLPGKTQVLCLNNDITSIFYPSCLQQNWSGYLKGTSAESPPNSHSLRGWVGDAHLCPPAGGDTGRMCQVKMGKNKSANMVSSIQEPVCCWAGDLCRIKVSLVPNHSVFL